MIDYAIALGANNEVLSWCKTTLEASLKKDPKPQEEVEHIIDFLVSDAAPSRLRKMSYDQAKKSSEKWTRANQKRGKNLVDTVDDIESIHDFLDGTKIVRLLSKKAYKREGFLMSHCLGGYNPDRTTIYSYRDASNYPHATFEVSKSGDEIVQVKGKGNGSIHPRYIHPILTFLKSIGLNVRPSDMINLGYMHINDEVLKLLNVFVDKNGNPAEIVPLFGERYVVAK